MTELTRLYDRNYTEWAHQNAILLKARRFAELDILLRKKPGLKSVFVDTINNSYPEAVELATNETGLSLETFPKICPYTQEQILDKEFYP